MPRRYLKNTFDEKAPIHNDDCPIDHLATQVGFDVFLRFKEERERERHLWQETQNS